MARYLKESSCIVCIAPATGGTGPGGHTKAWNLGFGAIQTPFPERNVRRRNEIPNGVECARVSRLRRPRARASRSCEPPPIGTDHGDQGLEVDAAMTRDNTNT